MKHYTQEEFDLFFADSHGNKHCPSGDYTLITKFPNCCYFGVGCSFGEHCSFGEGCTFGERCSFGDLCTFGELCSFGKCCSFGIFCSFGEWCSFGESCSFGECCSFGKDCIIGMYCSFGDNCSFAERCTFGDRCFFGKWCKCEFGEFQAMYTAGGFGSVARTSYFFHMADGSICVRCGCFSGGIDAWENRVKKTHGFNRYAQAYAMIGAAVRAICQK